MELPVETHVIDASHDRPYLGLTMEIDLHLIAQLMVRSCTPATRAWKGSLGIAVSKLTTSLIDAFNRLLDLLEQPEDIPTLAPLIQQEIFPRCSFVPNPRYGDISN